jgi:hypothetical protein
VQAQRYLPWDWMARRIAMKFTPTPEGRLKARQESVAYASTQRLAGTARGDFLRVVADVTGAIVDDLRVEVSLADRPTADDATRHPLEIENAEWDVHSIQTPIRVVGLGDAYFVPKEVRVVCRGPRGEQDECQQCPLTSTGERRLCFEPTNRSLLECIQATEFAKLKVLSRSAEARYPRFRVEQVGSQTLTEPIAYPQAQALEMSEDRTVMDELGREFRKKRFFYIGSKVSSVKKFLATGRVLANPRNQVATLLARLYPLRGVAQCICKALQERARDVHDLSFGPRG